MIIRRTLFLTGLAAGVSLIIASAVAIPPSHTVQGQVYYDQNGNQQKDPTETAAANVRVSTSWQTATTDAEGFYSLTSTNPILSVHVNIPAGTWPTGPWWYSVGDHTDKPFDFGLKQEEQNFPFAFVQITDPHLSFPEVLRSIPEECSALPLPPKFYFVTGDLLSGSPGVADPKVLGYYDEMHNIMAEAPAPFFVISGNHDPLRGSMDHPNFGHRLWERIIGPRNWMFSYADMAFVGIGWPDRIPNKGWEPWDRMEERAQSHQGSIPDDVRQIFMTHNARILTEPQRPLLWLHGHTHTEGSLPWADWVLSAGTAQNLKWDRSEPQPYGSDGRPVGYRLFVVEEDRVDHFFKATGYPTTIMVHSPRRHQKIEDATAATIKGQVLDPDQSIEELIIHLGGVQLEVALERKTLWVDFTATGNVSELTEGYHDLAIRAVWPDETAELKEPYLVCSGNLPDFEAKEPATISGRCINRKRAFELLVNGVVVGEVTDGEFTFDVPASALKRLNVISWPDGSKISPRMFDCTMTYQGGPFAPQLQSGSLAWFGTAPKQIIDLSYPGPVVRWTITTDQ